IVPLFGAWLLVVLFLGLLLASGAFIVLSASFAVMSAIPTVVTALTWPFTSLLLVYAYGDAVASQGLDDQAARPSEEPSPLPASG
ncbi:MAG: hypothetical protein Q7T71_09575, partial [Herbiconiux sp.]|nr:hypothetical protein [Herbiconiux sp.]